ncbi:hypothetical protein ASF04_06515 [Duganella sp. Leaf61]|uniref:ParB-like protein n=1 Tax=Duganella sp. Leaf61 TaxID=1736227 RepID=UPI0006FC359B|nr:ParB-like protein [Duganella sp. Leaf61]KQN75706.1 hypothetical protein ASF04_06515 [Duganella sp. Leaf61]
MHSTRQRPTGFPRHLPLLLTLPLLLAACGGGDANLDTTPTRAMTVVAATGKAMAGAAVTVQDAAKATVGSGTTDANGKLVLNLPASAAAPFLLTVTPTSGSAQYAVTVKETAVNVTPLTSVLAMQLLGTTPAATSASQLAAVDGTKIATAQTQLSTALADAMRAMGVSATYDFVNGPLVPGSSTDAADKLLDQLAVKVSGTDIDIVNTSGAILVQSTGGSVPRATGTALLTAPATPTARQQQLMAMVPGTAAAPVFIEVALDELLPTQPAVGYDQIYYKLGRYSAEDLIMDKTNKPKKFAELCEANGQDDVVTKTANVTGATLIKPPATFACKSPVGTKPGDMKTVVVGPGGKLYLTDGHHTFSAFWNADGGVNQKLKVWVKLTDNLSKLNEVDFWSAMKAGKKVWLKDGANRPIVTGQLPQQSGLAALGNDPYRALVYFTRDAGYVVPEASTEFLEFYWGDWLRSKIDLAGYDLTSSTSYASAILKASQAMVALQATDVVSGGNTAASLGWSGKLDTKALDDLVTPTGKLTYSIAYKKTLVK